MKIGFVGTRGIPANYGGFETFVQELSPFLVDKGFECVVYCDKNSHSESEFKGVQLKFLNITKSQNPLKYYFKSLKIAIKECDIIYVAGTGGAIFYPFLKNNKTKIITNTDGIEYKRDKWSFSKKIFIKIIECFAIKFSDFIIADSIGIKNYILNKYKVNSEKIIQLEYGAHINEYFDLKVLKEYLLEHNKYYLIVSRLEQENNVHMMIDGYLMSSQSMPLVIVGNLLQNDYVKTLLSKKNKNIYFLGGIYDSCKLKALRWSCFAHLHGHSVGGTNPSLLEALGSSNIIIAHDNIYNKEVAGEKMYYFNNPEELNSSFQKIESLKINERKIISGMARERIHNYYNWYSIGLRYYDFFNKIK